MLLRNTRCINVTVLLTTEQVTIPPFINKILQSETKKKLKDRNVPIETGSCVTKATLNMIQCSTRDIAIKVFQYCLISVCRHIFHFFLNSILLPNFTAYPLIVVR